MAGPGGGPPRRSHTKSRKGCDTCKRRHIRCDENFPQCKNCTKHNVRCPYMDLPPPEERSGTPERADLLWTPEIETQITMWQKTGAFPFPELQIYPAPNPAFFTFEDLRLVHHVASISAELSGNGAGAFTIWTNQIPLFLRIGATCGFVMHALLALSATHLAWLSKCPVVKQMAYEHRGVALKGLHEAIGAFSRQNSDSVLAASMLLSWQAPEWRGWTQLMQGTSSVIDAMQPWKNESQFGDFIGEQSTFPTAPPSPVPNKRFNQPTKQDIEALQHCFANLQNVQRAMTDQGEDTRPVAELIHFIRSIRKVSSAHNAAQRFEMLNPLREWLFWLPVMYLQQPRVSSNSLVVVAYYYTAALVVEPMFPEVGAAYFGSLSLNPIEEITRRLFSTNVSQENGHLHNPLALMEYPVNMVTSFRNRMGFQQPERTASFPNFMGNSQSYQQDMYQPQQVHTDMYSLGSNPSFTYSQEYLVPYTSAPPSSAISPLGLDPFAGASSQYLGLPSPNTYSDYNSPAGSSYDDAAYSDQGGDDYLYDNTMPSAFGGNRSTADLGGKALASPTVQSSQILSSSQRPYCSPGFESLGPSSQQHSPVTSTLPRPPQLPSHPAQPARQFSIHPYVPKPSPSDGKGKGRSGHKIQQ